MDPDSAEARQMMMVSLTDHDDPIRRQPFSAILEQCHDARYGDGGGGRDFMSPASTPF
jgi:hypothetical protein